MTEGRYWRALDRVMFRVRDCLKRGGHRLDGVYLDRLGFARDELDRVFDRPRSDVEDSVRGSIFTVDVNLRLPDRRVGVIDPAHGRKAMASLYRAASYSVPVADAPAPLKRLWLPDR
jgi:hypothetical protein